MILLWIHQGAYPQQAPGDLPEWVLFMPGPAEVQPPPGNMVSCKQTQPAAVNRGRLSQPGAAATPPIHTRTAHRAPLLHATPDLPVAGLNRNVSPHSGTSGHAECPGIAGRLDWCDGVVG